LKCSTQGAIRNELKSDSAWIVLTRGEEKGGKGVEYSGREQYTIGNRNKSPPKETLEREIAGGWGDPPDRGKRGSVKGHQEA